MHGVLEIDMILMEQCPDRQGEFNTSTAIFQKEADQKSHICTIKFNSCLVLNLAAQVV